MGLYEPPPENTYGFRKCCKTVKAVVPIEDVARRYTELRPLGGKAWFDGRCPLPDHDDHNPSFYIYPPRRWRCYGCDRGGDVIDLEFYCGGHAELWEAMITLKEQFNVVLPEPPQSRRRKQARQRPIRDAIDEAMIYAARRRLYRRYFEPIILATEDVEDRKHDAQLFWEATAAPAEHLVANLMGRQQ